MALTRVRSLPGPTGTSGKPGQPFFAHIAILETHKGDGWKTARKLPKSELVDPDKLKLAAYYPDSPIARDEYANYLDAIHLSDGYVGQLLARLEREGLADNTVVVLASDHGPLFRGKQFLYDGGIHIPLIIRFPDRKGAGTVDDRFVSAIDFRTHHVRLRRDPATGRCCAGPGYLRTGF